MSTRHRLVAWTKTNPVGAEIATVTIDADHLSAQGTAIGSDPQPYRLDYDLQTSSNFVTRTARITVAAETWGRSLDIARSDAGQWSHVVRTSGRLAPPATGLDEADLADALDLDLGLSPLFNTMPVLRHGLHVERDASHDFVMVWVSVPDLRIHRSLQQYTFLRAADRASAIVRFRSLDADSPFQADISVDHDGLVIDYPGLATRIPDLRAGPRGADPLRD